MEAIAYTGCRSAHERTAPLTRSRAVKQRFVALQSADAALRGTEIKLEMTAHHLMGGTAHSWMPMDDLVHSVKCMDALQERLEALDAAVDSAFSASCRGQDDVTRCCALAEEAAETERSAADLLSTVEYFKV